MRSYGLILTAGFAMFSMFFGSGNLVFPLLIGVNNLSQYPSAILGFLITAVCVPFLGLLGMISYQGDRQAYFSRLTKGGAFILTFLMLALMGPFGVIPRCITVAFGGVAVWHPTLTFWIFSLGFCLLTAALIWKRNRIVSIIGLVLTPLKLGSILFLILFGLWYGHPINATHHSSFDAFWSGISHGYQTMDLMAAFFFACTIYEYLYTHYLQKQQQQPHVRQLVRAGIQASLLGASLLALVYIGFTALGAEYAPYLQATAPESFLVEIAKQALGIYAVPFVAFTLAVSCLATATVLTTLFVDFLQNEISGQRLSRPQSIFLTLSMTFAMSLLGFQTICQGLGMVLEWIYPFLVAYALFQIVCKRKASTTVVRCSL